MLLDRSAFTYFENNYVHSTFSRETEIRQETKKETIFSNLSSGFWPGRMEGCFRKVGLVLCQGWSWPGLLDFTLRQSPEASPQRGLCAKALQKRGMASILSSSRLALNPPKEPGGNTFRKGVRLEAINVTIWEFIYVVLVWFCQLDINLDTYRKRSSQLRNGPSDRPVGKSTGCFFDLWLK